MVSSYNKNSISLIGAVGLGTGVMISAGIFALLGQVAALSGTWFPIIFILGGIVTSFSAYSYTKLSQAYPSAGGIGMYLVKAYGKGTIAAGAAMLMALSMVINQSLVARTFGMYTLQLFSLESTHYFVPLLGVALLIFAFIMNVSGNTFIQSFTSIASLIKIIGLVVFALSALWVANFALEPAELGNNPPDPSRISYVAAIALTILSFKGFTTITNSGSEIKKPTKNVARAIVISITISMFVYVLLAWSVAGSLSLTEIIEAQDYALAKAARPALGDMGVWFTVGIAIIATITGIIASVFAVSRMLAMLTDMKLIPHRHFGMSGSIQKHTLVYTIVIAISLTVFFDLSRIASMGAILYLIMDMIIHWGVWRYLRQKLEVNQFIVLTAFVLDAIIFSAFIWVKWNNDPLIIIISIAVTFIVFTALHFFLRYSNKTV